MADEAKNIWNRASSRVAAPRITSVTEVSTQKEIIDDHWPGTRKAFLQLSPWIGATTVTTLVVEDPKPTNAPARYSKAFALPTAPGEFLQGWRLNNLTDDGPQPEYEIFTFDDSGQKSYLLTSEGTAHLEWTYDLDTDPFLAKLQGLAVSALVLAMALAIGYAWHKSEQEMRLIDREYQGALRIAKSKNSRQAKRRKGYDRPLVDARD